MDIKTADSDAEILACYHVMKELRPHLTEDSFVGRVREQQEAGYRLVYAQDGSGPVAVAGFRFGRNLAWGKFLYVDDLVTAPNQRSHGYGAALLSWLKDLAEREDCDQLHLDSGVRREDAHRFYHREGMEHSSHHYRIVLRTGGPSPGSTAR